MKLIYIRSLLGIACILISFSVHSQEGQSLFQTHCSVCHTIGGGKLVGPDLLNVQDKQSPEWLVSFIQSSQKMINSGDSAALAIYQEFNKILMPDPPLTEQQVRAVLDYIASAGKVASAGTAAPSASKPAQDLLAGTSAVNVQQGLLLFTGKQRLTGGGPACGSCHKVTDDRVFTSGSLAKDLTQSFEILGSAGVAAILRNPPFPVMGKTYAISPLNEADIIDLTAYLKSVSDQRIYQHPRNYSGLFGLTGGFIFIIALTGIYLLYYKRKKAEVNLEIFRRQQQTVN